MNLSPKENFVPQRLSARVFLDQPGSESIDIEAWNPVFHNWISTGKLEETVIDVVDYSHVPEGPALMLVALEADYVLDFSDGRPGVRYIRKRDVPETLPEALNLVVSRAVAACRLLEQALSVSFDNSVLEIEVQDKLRFGHNGAGKVLQLALSELINGGVAGEVHLEKVSIDERRPLRIQISNIAASLADLENHIQKNTEKLLLQQAAGS